MPRSDSPFLQIFGINFPGPERQQEWMYTKGTGYLYWMKQPLPLFESVFGCKHLHVPKARRILFLPPIEASTFIPLYLYNLKQSRTRSATEFQSFISSSPWAPPIKNNLYLSPFLRHSCMQPCCRRACKPDLNQTIPIPLPPSTTTYCSSAPLCPRASQG